MKVHLFSAKSYDKDFFSREISADANIELHYLPVKLTAATVPLAQGADVVCCFVNDQLNAEVLDALHALNVRLVALRCAGFNNVDLAHAQDLGITVCRVPEYSPYAVAEHAVALILDLNRNIHRAHNRVRENDYSLDGLMGFDLHGKTVGVVGFGKIGRAFAAIMRGFGCRILISDPLASAADIADQGALVALADLLGQSDVVSLHCPLTPQTHHLISTQTIAQMKDNGMLINTSRGGLIDTPAVIQALKTRKIGYLGIDVYEEEANIFFEDLSNMAIQDDVFARLQTFPNVIITGHQGFFTEEALTKIAQTTVANIVHFSRNQLEQMHRVLP